MKKNEKSRIDDRLAAVQRILKDEMIPVLDKKVDQIVKDVDATVNRARSQSRRCRKPAS